VLAADDTEEDRLAAALCIAIAGAIEGLMSSVI
jgi:hypothetical protein